MSLKIKPVNISERDELEPMLIGNPGVIQEGLRVMAHQLQTDSGPLDILAVDSGHVLVVIELKNEATDGHLDQGLRYYDWCRQNLGWITLAYKGAEIDAKTPPRLFLIAPSFTDNVKRIAKYINADLKLLEYHAIENEKGERGLICTELDFGQPPQPSIMTIEEKLKYCTDDTVRDLFKAVLDELKTQGIEVKPIGGRDITFWYKGKRFMWMAPRRKAFAANVLSSGGTWIGTQNIAARKDWDKVYTSQVKPYLTYLDATNEE